MKIYTIDQELKLQVYKSAKEFLKTNNWCDSKFISVVDSNQLKDLYAEPYRQWGVVHSEKQKHAHNMLYAINAAGI